MIHPADSATTPRLDALAQSCFLGDLPACDHLYLQSPVGSAYEEYGDSCAGRQEAGTETYCALGGPLEPTPPENLGTDPALDALASDCYIGDMAACDELYDSSEQGSDYQIYGDTCAGRQPQNTGLLCTTLANPVPGTPPETSVPETTTLETLPPDTSVPETTTLETLPPDTSVPETTTLETLPPDTSVPETTTLETLPPDTSVPETTTLETLPPDTGVPETGVIVTEVPETTPSSIPAPTEEPVGLGSDPTLDAFAQACYDGDMAACDNLYNESEPDSEYRRYGDTCAGRQPEGTGIWCRTAFGDGTPSTNVTVPPLTVPPVTVPPVTVPPLTAPPGTVPPLTVPQLTVPPLTVPPVTVPPLTAPPIVPTSPTLPVIPTVPTTPGSTLPGTTVPGAIPPPTLQPTGLGTNATLDALALACYNGDMASCDELFRGSDPELDLLYRDYGDTCAGRQPVGTGRWCEVSFPATGLPTTVPGTIVTVPGTGPIVTIPATVVPGIPPATQQPTGLGNDPQLNVLAESCYNGDMQACDDLFLQSELGSTYHDYGDTCAGRQPTGTYTYCRVAFPGVQP